MVAHQKKDTGKFWSDEWFVHTYKRTKEDIERYPHDGAPEHGYFINLQGHEIHTYVWYPPFWNGSTSNGADAVAAADCSSTHTAQQHENNTESPARPLSRPGLAARGIIVLIGGEHFHTRYDWLRKQLPPFYKTRDPTRMGYYDTKICVEEEVVATVPTPECVGGCFADCSSPPISPESTAESSKGGSSATQEPCVYFKKSWVDGFRISGYIVVGIDLQGQGLSEGLDGVRGNVHNFDDYVQDVVLLLKLIRLRYGYDSPLWPFHEGSATRQQKQSSSNQSRAGPDSLPQVPYAEFPIFLIGLSMGGLIALGVLQQLETKIRQHPTDAQRRNCNLATAAARQAKEADRPLRLQGCILVSPTLDVSNRKSWVFPTYRPFLWLMSSLSPNTEVTSYRVNIEYKHLQDCEESDLYANREGTHARLFCEIMEKSESYTKAKELARLQGDSCKSVLLVQNLLDTTVRHEAVNEFSTQRYY